MQNLVSGSWDGSTVLPPDSLTRPPRRATSVLASQMLGGDGADAGVSRGFSRAKVVSSRALRGANAVRAG